MDGIWKVIETLSGRFETHILIGDFNAEEPESAVKDFCEIYTFKNLKKMQHVSEILTSLRSQLYGAFKPELKLQPDDTRLLLHRTHARWASRALLSGSNHT